MLTAGPVDQPSIVAIVGPTATGKTDAAVCLARTIRGEIVSADSMAVYRGMDVGTAKPDAAQRASVPFHVIDVAEPDEPFSVSRFKSLAEQAVADILRRGRRPMVVGGTGLYVRALLEDYGLASAPPDPAVRATLDAEAARAGTEALHARLAAADPLAASRIHPNDRVRIVRALEVYLRTGEPMSLQQERDAARRRQQHRRPARKFALTAPREELYRRIDARVGEMIARGLVPEVARLLSRGYAPALQPLRSLGYKEIAAHLTGECSLDEAVAAIKRNTRRFAKRQLTWFRADAELIWIDVTDMTPEETAAEMRARLAG